MYYFMAAEHETKNRIVLIKPRIVRSDLKSHSKTYHCANSRKIGVPWTSMENCISSALLHLFRSFGVQQIFITMRRVPSSKQIASFFMPVMKVGHLEETSTSVVFGGVLLSLSGRLTLRIMAHQGAIGTLCVLLTALLPSLGDIFIVCMLLCCKWPLSFPWSSSAIPCCPTNRPSSHQEKESSPQSKYDWWPLRDKWLHLVEFASSLKLRITEILGL